MKIKEISAQEVWPIRHEVMWPNMPFDFIKLKEDSKGIHFGLFLNDELMSVISLFETSPEVAQFRKFATKMSAQNKGYGSKLLTHTMVFAKKKGFKSLWCNARVDKTAYYKNFGMVETEDTFVKEKVRFVILKKVF